MALLSICLFGSVRVVHQHAPLAGSLTHAAQGLLAYLVLFRQRLFPRNVLCGIFWGEHQENRARHCLNTALWRLRCLLEPGGVARGTFLITKRSGEVGFNAESDHWLDVEAFEKTVGSALNRPHTPLTDTDLLALRRALGLYTGDLLEAFYDEWALRERERLRMMYLGTLARLMRHHAERSAWEDAVKCGRRIVELDPLREEIHRELMRLYACCGQRALAVQQYDTCRGILARELDIAPMPETQALYAEIARGAGVSVSSPPLRSAPTDAVLTSLRLALYGIDDARLRLRRVLQLIGKQPQEASGSPNQPR